MFEMHVGSTYEIRFMDSESPAYTWFAGTGVFVRDTAEDFGTGEQHYIFAVGEDECCFPASAIMQETV